MPKTSTNNSALAGKALQSRTLNGPTMGSRWSVCVETTTELPWDELEAALQQAVTDIDERMSRWRPESELMRLNRADTHVWHPVSQPLFTVLERGIAIGRASDGAFDIGLGDLINAWGFGPYSSDPQAIKDSLGKVRMRADQFIDLDRENLRVRKVLPADLDLSAIAKGYGVDRLIETLQSFGVDHALAAIDGELRALSTQADGRPWSVAVEAPDPDDRHIHSVLELDNAAVATSGDYRHRANIGNSHVAHTMLRERSGPMPYRSVSVSVVAATAMDADAWATALLVMDQHTAVKQAEILGLNALFLNGEPPRTIIRSVGPLFKQHETGGH